MNRTARRSLFALALLPLALAAPGAFAQAFPSKPIRVIVSFPPGAMSLQKGKNPPIVIPVGTAARNEGQTVHVTHQGQGLQLKVLGVMLYNQPLATQLAAYLNGRQPPPDAANFKMPIYLFVLTLLPFIVPILTRGGAIWGALGGGLWFACLLIAKQQQIPLIARILLILLISAGSIGATIAMMAAVVR